jgi:hypothetical protein
MPKSNRGSFAPLRSYQERRIKGVAMQAQFR